MGSTADLADDALRYYNTDGVPASGNHSPSKADLKAVFHDADNRIGSLEASQGGGRIGVDAFDDLTLNYAANTIAEVYPDVVIESVSRSRSSNVATIETNVPHGYLLGQYVTNTEFGDATFDAVGVEITEVPDTTHYKYANAGSNVGNTADTAGRIHQRGVYLKDGGSGSGEWIWNRPVTNDEVDTRLDTLEDESVNKDGSVAYTGNQSLNGNKLTDLGAATDANDALRKTQAVLRDGTQAFAADQPMGGFKITGLGAASAGSDALRKNQAMLLDGTQAMAADLHAGGFKVTNLAAAAADNDAIRKVQAQDLAEVVFISSVSGTNTMTGTNNPPQSAWRTGVLYRWKMAAANSSTTVTMNPSSLGAKTVKEADGSGPRVGRLTTSGYVDAVYDGTDLIIVAPALDVGVNANPL